MKVCDFGDSGSLPPCGGGLGWGVPHGQWCSEMARPDAESRATRPPTPTLPHGTVAFGLLKGLPGLTVFGADGRRRNDATLYPKRLDRRRNCQPAHPPNATVPPPQGGREPEIRPETHFTAHSTVLGLALPFGRRQGKPQYHQMNRKSWRRLSFSAPLSLRERAGVRVVAGPAGSKLVCSSPTRSATPLTPGPSPGGRGETERPRGVDVTAH